MATALAACADRGSGREPSLQQRLVKTGGRLIKHARYYWSLMAESHLTRQLFAGRLRKITLRRRDKARRRAEQISMTAPETQGSVRIIFVHIN